MMVPQLRILLDDPTARYRPGDRLAGRFLCEGVHVRSIRAAELSVLWYTTGKGEEDFAVHHFERFVEEPLKPLDLRVPRRFTTLLPPSPLSYEGQIVKLCWCVRVRLFLPHAPDLVEEVPFQLGGVGVPVPVAAEDPNWPPVVEAGG